MSAAIWNKDQHSMADLPKEILTKLFKEIRGRDLIQLSGVCSTFNDLINSSPQFTDKIAFKIPPSDEGSTYTEAGKTLDETKRDYKHLSVHDMEIDNENMVKLLKEKFAWKSLKMRSCYFQSAEMMVRFLSMMAEDLEEIDFNHVVAKNWSYIHTRLQVAFPKLQKLKSTHFHIDFYCTSLKELELRCAFSDFPLKLLKTNKIEVLTLTYGDIAVNFKRGNDFDTVPVCIKKLVIKDLGSQNPVGFTALQNFQIFMTEQTSIEEFGADTYIHYDNFARLIGTVFQFMSSVKKVVINDRYQPNPPLTLRIQPNESILELHFNREFNEMSKILFRKVVAACPKAKKLKVLNIDQQTLKDCSLYMTKLESIEAKTFTLEELRADYQFLELKRVKFFWISIKNNPELSRMPARDRENTVLEMLRGPPEVEETEKVKEEVLSETETL